MTKNLLEQMLEDRYIGIPLNNIHCSDGATPDGNVVAWSTYVFVTPSKIDDNSDNMLKGAQVVSLPIAV